MFIGKLYFHIVPKNESKVTYKLQRGEVYLNMERFGHCCFHQVIKFGISNGETP